METKLQLNVSTLLEIESIYFACLRIALIAKLWCCIMVHIIYISILDFKPKNNNVKTFN